MNDKPYYLMKSGESFHIPDLPANTGIKSFKGMGNLEINGKTVTLNDGEVWDIELTNGSFYNCQEGCGGHRYDSSGLACHS
jgi:hypothetical protein